MCGPGAASKSKRTSLQTPPTRDLQVVFYASPSSPFRRRLAASRCGHRCHLARSWRNARSRTTPSCPDSVLVSQIAGRSNPFEATNRSLLSCFANAPKSSAESVALYWSTRKARDRPPKSRGDWLKRVKEGVGDKVGSPLSQRPLLEIPNFVAHFLPASLEWPSRDKSGYQNPITPPTEVCAGH